MIKVTITMKNDAYNYAIEMFYTHTIGMEKVGDLVFYSDKDVFVKTCNAFRALLSKEWFKNNVLSFEQDTDGEVVNLIEQFDYEKRMIII